MRRVQQIVVGVVGAALVLLMILLGLWQMQVFESQKSQTTAQRAAEPPKPLEQNLVEGSSGALFGHRVTATGRYLPHTEVLMGTAWPMAVVQALHTTGGRTLTVVRGTVPRGATIPPAPTGERTVSGVILPSQAVATVPLPSGAPSGSLDSLRLERLAQSWPQPMVDGFVSLDAGQSAAQGLGAYNPVIPDVSGGRVRNQGYALQWWAFAILGAVGTVVGVRQVGGRPETASSGGQSPAVTVPEVGPAASEDAAHHSPATGSDGDAG